MQKRGIRCRSKRPGVVAIHTTKITATTVNTTATCTMTFPAYLRSNAKKINKINKWAKQKYRICASEYAVHAHNRHIIQITRVPAIRP